MTATNMDTVKGADKETITRLESEIAEIEGGIKKLSQIGIAGFGILLVVVFLFFSHLGAMFDNDLTSCVTGIVIVLMLPGAFVLRKKWDGANSQLAGKQKELAQKKAAG